MFACRRRPGPVVFAALVAVLLAVPVAARAATAPVFQSRPTIQGDAIVGSTLQVVPTWTGDPAPTVTYTWSRCMTATACSPIVAGPGISSYTVTAEEVGYQIKAQVALTNYVMPDPMPMETPLTAVVVPAPTPAPPPPTPDPAPVAPPPPATTAASSAAAPKAPSFLRPFPVIRIRGFFARNGARITLLSVRGPRKAKVNVRCSGHGCPVRRLSLATADTRVHRFERFLRAGILLQIRVTRPRRIGTYTSFLIRSRKAPLRRDRCLSATRGMPIKCSAP
jgi:hypothetical protein